jgi:hypothetical protein
MRTIAYFADFFMFDAKENDVSQTVNNTLDDPLVGRI